MPESVQVLEEAQVEQPERGRRAWASVGLAFAVGVAFGAVFFGPVVDPTADLDAVPDDSPVAPGEEVGPVGLARAVPDFPDALVAIVGSQAAGIEHLLWPLARGTSTRSLPVSIGATVSIDPSGGWVALLTSVPDAEGSLLLTGRSTAVRPIVSGVDSYAWHDTGNGNIGFLRFHDGSWGLWRASAYPLPEFVIDLGGEYPGELVAFGEWGWALQRSSGFRVVTEGGSRDYQGRLLDTMDGEFLSLVGGDVILHDAAGNAVVVVDGSPGVIDARLSLDGSRIAVLESAGVIVVDVAGETPPALHSLSPAGQVAWSSDSRFVIVPTSPRGLRIIDLRTGESRSYFTDRTVFWVGVVPLSGRS